MVFSTPVFLFAFLPAVLCSCWVLAGVAKRLLPTRLAWLSVNAFLLAASLFFYFWGEGRGVLWLCASLVANDLFARLVHRVRGPVARKLVLSLAVASNLAFLGWFKYAGFLAGAVDLLPGVDIPVPRVALPLGISFYTFQAMSYVVDVYRGVAVPAPTVLDFGAYLVMFPQLVAGPIVRYVDVAARLRDRSTSVGRVASGMRRFLRGLSKKVLLANVLAAFADPAWSFVDRGVCLPASLAWLALVAYALQIYYDFSGYSDMAIGIGRMLGFDFPENFFHPYAAVSVRDFWRRWHVTLSAWFRDYLYIPLGGNRKGRLRTVFNAFAVFALCGLWHGASAMFLLWGLWHGFFVALERFVFRKAEPAAVWSRCLGHVYATAVFLFGWLLFRCENLGSVGVFLRSLAGCTAAPETRVLFIDASPKLFLAVFFGLLFAYGFPARARGGAGASGPVPSSRLGAVFLDLFLTLSGLLSLLMLVGGSYNPFIYFRF